jgi:sRNA-binding protein
MGQLKEWVKQDWVRIDSKGNIAGKCGTSKNKKNPDRCLPRKKAQSLSKSERAATARKKKKAGAKGKQVVANTPKAKVRSKKTKKY